MRRLAPVVRTCVPLITIGVDLGLPYHCRMMSVRIPRWSRWPLAPQFTLQRKVLLVLVSLVMALLVVLVGLSVWGLQHSLGDYAADIELARMDWFARRLEQAYAEHGSWDFLAKDPSAWRDLQRSGARSAGIAPVPCPKSLPEPPQVPLTTGALQSAVPDSGAPPWRPRMYPGFIVNRTGLLNAEADRVLAGNPGALGVRKLLALHVQNQRIGYLAVVPLQTMSSQTGRAFLQQQSLFVLVTGGVGALLALVLSWLISRRLLRPIHALMTGADAVAHGRLDQQVPVRGNDELSQLCRTFNAMAQQLSQSQAVRQRWLSDVAHELRTPLAAMRAEIESIQDGVRVYTPATGQRLHRQVLRLGQLVEDLRTSMERAPGEDRRVPGVAPLELLLETLALAQAACVQVGIRVETTELQQLAQRSRLFMLADPARLQQLFMNVLDNSLNYTHAPGVLVVRAGIPEPGRLRIQWDDSAPAPLAQDLPRLFERLYRTDLSRSRNTGGSGLGLAICKAIVHEHGGTIGADASALGGLRITVEFPLLTPESSHDDAVISP